MEQFTLEELELLQGIMTKCQLTISGKDSILRLAGIISKIDGHIASLKPSSPEDSSPFPE